MSDNHTYKIKYGFDPEMGEFTPEQIKEAKAGGTDALVLFNILFPKDNQWVCDYASIDGRTKKPLSDEEIFRVWIFLSNKLSQSGELDDGKKTFCGEVFKTFVKIVEQTEANLKKASEEKKEEEPKE